MKKILISVLIVLLIILVYFAIWRGIPFAKIKSIKDIKTASKNLDKNIEKSHELANQTYPAKIQTLDEAIKNLKLAKQEYESKNPYGDESGIGSLEVKTYKIHYLWTILGNYRKDEGVRSLTLDLKSTSNKDVYDLQFTLVGEYIAITDFLYGIEDDEELKFEVKNLSIMSLTTANETANTATTANANTTKTGNTTNTTTSTTKRTLTTTEEKNGTLLQATFTVQNIGITLD